MAYNWGARGRAAGLSAPDLLPIEGWPAGLPLTLAELESLARLGPDAWERWALKGWAEAPAPVELN